VFIHRNSPKRIYLDGAVYFVTFRTSCGFSYFHEEIFCDIFMENLKLCKRLKEFKLYAYDLLYEHTHLLLRPGERYDISKIMKSLKENVSCDINRVMGTNVSETLAFRLREIGVKKRLDYGKYCKRYLEEYGKGYPEFPPFRWLRSFHEHVIRNEKDFRNHLRYVMYNHLKHGLPEDWKYTSLNNGL